MVMEDSLCSRSWDSARKGVNRKVYTGPAGANALPERPPSDSCYRMARGHPGTGARCCCSVSSGGPKQHLLPHSLRDLPACCPNMWLQLQVSLGGSQRGGPQELGDRALSPQPGRWRASHQRREREGRGHTLEQSPRMTRAEAPPAGGQLTSKYKPRHHGAAHSGALAAGQAHRGEAPRTAPAHISSGVGMLWSGALRETRDEERQHIPKLKRWTPQMVQVECCNRRTYKERRPKKSCT